MGKIQKSKKELALLVPNIALDNPLGEGGNAIVYSGQHVTLGTVAVKFMLNDNTKRYLRFCDEVKVVTGRLKGSARVIPIFEVSLTAPADSVPYYVMPQAESLKKVLNGVGWGPKLVALAELAEGLSEIHRADVAHRDIKPENIFFFEGTYRFGDFGIASFPENAGITEENEPMGPWAFMANEMLSNPTTADAFKADVYSFAKTMWSVLTDEKVPFSGQYSSTGRESLATRQRAGDLVIEPLEALLRDSTSSNPDSRPSADIFVARLRHALLLQEDSRLANTIQWGAAEDDAFLNNAPLRAEWYSVNDIAKVMSLLSRRKGLNHFFFPEGGGHQIESVEVCEGGTMLGLNIPFFGQYLVSPVRLTLERFVGKPELSYAVLELRDIPPLEPSGLSESSYLEELIKLNDFDYIANDNSDYDDGDGERIGSSAYGLNLPCERRFRGGVCVLAPTGGIFNRIDDYCGTGEALGRDLLREQFEVLARKLEASAPVENVKLDPRVRLLVKPQERIEFILSYLDGSQLTELIKLDDDLRAERQKEDGLGSRQMMKAIMGEPTKLQAKRNQMQRESAPAQIAELFSLMLVGRGDLSPQNMAARTQEDLKDRLEPGYVFSKMGNGYLRKGLERFGLTVTLPDA